VLSRRDILALCAALAAMGLTGLALPGQAHASPKDARKRLAGLTGGVKPIKKGVTIALPKVTDQGNHIPLRVSVDSPMTEDDYVKAIHVVSERNPIPAVATFHLSPASGKAAISTRIRLVKTQVVMVAAETSSGVVYLGKARCKISTGAGGCG
jgi:sulfur-oxidizing protein SoxY